MKKLISYTKINILTISLFFSIVIYILINCIFNLTVNANNNININKDIKQAIIEKDSDTGWKIEIPKINLIAPISEGISLDTMNKYVGHFPTTSKWNGNIGLAAHNRRLSRKLF